MIIDIHTHDPQAAHALISVGVGDFAPQPGKFYSAGIHPWRSEEAAAWHIERLEELARRDDVLAVGECGIDKLRGADLQRQMELLREQARVSEAVGKPMVLHCVRAWNEVMALRREMKSTRPWVIHGFRGNANVARQLLDGGFFLSVGEHFNAEAVRMVPTERLLVETDEARLPIGAVIARVAAARDEDAEALRQALIDTTARLLRV